MLLLMLLAMTGCAILPWAHDDWSTKDTITEAAYLTLQSVDWAQTRYIASHPENFYEKWNPVLGQHPSTQSVDLWFLAWTVLHPAISYALPRPYREIWQYTTITIEGAADINNAMIGVRF